MDKQNSECIAAIGRRRELRLLVASETAAIFDMLITILGEKRAMDTNLLEFKESVVANETALAQQEYSAAIRRHALFLMEADRRLSAEEAEATIDAVVLEALIGE